MYFSYKQGTLDAQQPGRAPDLVISLAAYIVKHIFLCWQQRSRLYVVSWCICKITLLLSFNLISKQINSQWFLMFLTSSQIQLVAEFAVHTANHNYTIPVQLAHCTYHYANPIAYINSLAFSKAIGGSQVVFFLS